MATTLIARGFVVVARGPAARNLIIESLFPTAGERFVGWAKPTGRGPSPVGCAHQTGGDGKREPPRTDAARPPSADGDPGVSLNLTRSAPGGRWRARACHLP